MHTHTHTHIHAHIMIYLYLFWVLSKMCDLTCNPATEPLNTYIDVVISGCILIHQPATFSRL